MREDFLIHFFQVQHTTEKKRQCSWQLGRAHAGGQMSDVLHVHIGWTECAVESWMACVDISVGWLLRISCDCVLFPCSS